LKFSKQASDQLTGKTCVELIAALLRDGFEHEETRGATQAYRHKDGRRVVIHYHPGTSYGPKLLGALLEVLGWSEAEMRRLKLIK
jgi:predicted RNA binding protein YcfA (HicA-like mRNA interferase family)